jgi:hypothetical protein
MSDRSDVDGRIKERSLRNRDIFARAVERAARTAYSDTIAMQPPRTVELESQTFIESRRADSNR